MAYMHISAGLIGLAVGFSVVNAVVPPEQFIEFDKLSFADGTVQVTREVTGDNTVAGWSVYVFEGDDGDLVCEGAGTSNYTASEPTDRIMALDAFVGDQGCLERLKPGTVYTVQANWLPLDKRDPVLERFEIEVAK